MCKNYSIDYVNEIYYRKLERSLKKYNMLAFKKLVFDCYPSLRDGDFIGKVVSTNEDDSVVYEVTLPIDALFIKVHGELKLVYIVNEKEKKVYLDKIIPESILDEGHKSQLDTYKGVMVSKSNAQRDMFKIDLLNMLNK